MVVRLRNGMIRLYICARRGKEGSEDLYIARDRSKINNGTALVGHLRLHWRPLTLATFSRHGDG
jgi:hypothetical protein